MSKPDFEFPSADNCTRCTHWVWDPALKVAGECHKRSPLYIDGNGIGVWPRTGEFDRCGDFRLRREGE